MTSASGVSCTAIKAVKPSGAPNTYQAENAAEADEDYDKFPETVAELKEFGFGAYRMSLSWSRIMTYTVKGGKVHSSVNQAGVEHYRQVLAAMSSAGIEVALTLWHWDTPQVLENQAYQDPACMLPGARTGSFWLCASSAGYFEEYVQTVLKELGSSVRFWITLNEPLTVISNGYAGSGVHAPGRCSNRTLCWDGDDNIEPFHAAHNMLRAHSQAYQAWNSSSTKRADSVMGLTLNGDYGLPVNHSSQADAAAADRFMQYQMAIFFDPIYYGRWPEAVVAGNGANLPTLDPSIRGTHGGIYFQNHYTTQFSWASDTPRASGYLKTANFSSSGYSPETKKPIGLPSSNGWLFNYPPGLALTQNWLHARYPAVAFMVTENGWGNASTTMQEDVQDIVRCNYYRGYIGDMATNAHKQGISVLGYFAWSIMDNYEWADGFSTRFGLTYVDYDTQVRTPKLSMKWFKGVTALDVLPTDGDSLPLCEAYA